MVSSSSALLRRGDVAQVGEEMDRIAFRVHYDGVVDIEPDESPVFGEAAFLHIHGFDFPADELLELVLFLRKIFRKGGVDGALGEHFLFGEPQYVAEAGGDLEPASVEAHVGDHHEGEGPGAREPQFRLPSKASSASLRCVVSRMIVEAPRILPVALSMGETVRDNEEFLPVLSNPDRFVVFDPASPG